MNGAKIASDIAKALISEKKMNLIARIAVVSIQKNQTVLEMAILRDRGIV